MMNQRRVTTHKDIKKAFTLIELLVVLGIISILAAILFPVFARVRENTRRASCLSNLKQIGLGVMMYTQDYDARYPRSRNKLAQKPPNGSWGSSGGEYYWYWQQTIFPYTKSDQIYYCPSSQGTALPYRGQYGANDRIINRYSSVTLADVDSPTTTYMAMDAGLYRLTYYWVEGPRGVCAYLPGTEKFLNLPTGVGPTPLTGWCLQDYQSDGRHFDGNNVIFADGHAKWVQVEKMWTEVKKYGHSDSAWDRN